LLSGAKNNFLDNKDKINLQLSLNRQIQTYMQLLFTSDELELEYPKIYGIASSTRHTRMGYFLSIHPDLHLEYYPDIINYPKDSVHPSFIIRHLDDNYKCLMIKNKGTNGWFYKRYQKVDYLLCATNEEEISKEILEIIRNIDSISLLFVLDKPSQKEILNFTQLQ